MNSETVEKLRSGLQVGRDHTHDALADHDAKYQRHPATETDRQAIADDLSAIDEALALLPSEPTDDAKDKRIAEPWTDFDIGQLAAMMTGRLDDDWATLWTYLGPDGKPLSVKHPEPEPGEETK